MSSETSTRTTILAAAKQALLDTGYAELSTRKIAVAAGVPLSQIHYHFGSKQGLMLEVLGEENRMLLLRQKAMYSSDAPLWQQWEQACDFLDADIASGYIRVLQEMVAAGWSNPDIAGAVRAILQGWFELLADVAGRVADRAGGLGPFTAAEVGFLAGAPFLAAEAMILLRFDDTQIPMMSALRKIGHALRSLEEGR